jgi:ribosomal protein S27E
MDTVTLSSSEFGQVLKKMKESLTCSLCQELFRKPLSLACLHVYCKQCLHQHTVASQKAGQIRCPLCNKRVTIPENGVEGFMVAFHQDNQLEIYFKMAAIICKATTPHSPHTQPGEPSEGMVDIATSTVTPHPTGGLGKMVDKMIDIPINTTTLDTHTGEPSTRVVDLPTSTDTLHTLIGGPSTRMVDVSTRTATPHTLTGGPNTRVVDAPTRTATSHTLTCGSNTKVVDVPTSTATPHTMTGGPSTRMVDVPTRIATLHTLTARKLHQFDVDFKVSGITCLPTGNVVVCEYNSNTVMMLTETGQQVMDLQTPPETAALDVDSTIDNIFVTDRKTESVLVFDYQGCLVSYHIIYGLRDISGISISNSKMYISGEGRRNNMFEMDLSDTSELSNQRQFAAGVQLNSPSFVSARDDVVAISCFKDHCVHCLDSGGKLKYTHGEPGQEGSAPYQLGYPHGVVVDRHNRLFISDWNNDRVCVVSDEGRLLGYIDLSEHAVMYPYCLTIDTAGNLLVACEKADYSQCIVKFEYTLIQ